MKKIKFLFVITLLFSLTFSIKAQTQVARPQEVLLDQEPKVPGKPISNLPLCFCCNDKIYQLQQPNIKGDDLICKDTKNIFNTIGCEGANIQWSANPAGISFTGQGTSSIQIDYASIPACTSVITLAVQISCGKRVVSHKIQVKVCPKQIVVSEGEDAILHGLDKLYTPSGLNQKDTNFGNYESNHVSTWTYLGTPGTVRSLIKFKLPEGCNTAASISSAKIVFKEHIAPGGGAHSGAYGSAVNQPTSFVLRKVTSPWLENTVTWNTMPSNTPVGEIDVVAYSGGSDDITIDVTSLLKTMTTTNNGFLLRWKDDSLTSYYRARWFGSFEAPAGKKPVLIIN